MPLWQQLLVGLAVCAFAVVVLVCIGLAAELTARSWGGDA